MANQDASNREENILRIYNQAIDIIKKEKSINVANLIIQLADLNKDIDSLTLITAIRRLEYDRANNIKIQGSIYPYTEGARFIYNELPTLEEFTKNLPHTEVINKATKSEPKYICPECGGDVRKRLDMVLTSNPVKYRYECDNPNCTYVAYHEV